MPSADVYLAFYASKIADSYPKVIYEFTRDVTCGIAKDSYKSIKNCLGYVKEGYNAKISNIKNKKESEKRKQDYQIKQKITD
jgi:predicted AlkP superfamily phosphohydrolase/phosphomutase